jgi:hypothetical protein
MRQHWIQFKRLSSFTSNFSSSSSFITTRESRENSSIFETIKILMQRFVEIREIRKMMIKKATRWKRVKTKKLSEDTLTKIRFFFWARFWAWTLKSNRNNFVCAWSYFFNKTSMFFMFESFTISIISKVTIKVITKTTKIVIKSIKEKFASNEDKSN